MIQYKE